MFLCKDCHKDVNCNNPFCAIALDGGMGASVGTCEICKKRGICADCHGYGPINTNRRINVKTIS